MKTIIAFLVLILSLQSTGCTVQKTVTDPALVNLQQNKAAIVTYYDTGKYEEEIKSIATEAENYINRILKSGRYNKPAIIFDIDDTLLNNYPFYQRTGFRFSSSTWKQWVNIGEIPSIKAMHGLFLTYVDKIDVFIITGRSVFQRAQTIRNLKSQGYDGWKNIFFKEEWDRGLSAKQYKYRILKQIVEKDKYQFIANFGDQESDFAYPINGRNFKLPNYLYITK